VLKFSAQDEIFFSPKTTAASVSGADTYQEVLRAAAVKLALQLFDLKLEMRDQRSFVEFTACARAAIASASRRAARSARIIA
jgi:hypothetical protein